MSENVVSQPDARPKICRIVVIVRSSAGVSSETREVQALDAGRIPKGKLPLAGKRWIEITNMAKLVVESSKDLGPDPEVKRQIAPHLPIVLGKDPIIVGAIFMVIHTTSPKTE